MPDAGVGEAILIGSLLSAGVAVAGQTILKPKMPGIPSAGVNPGGVPNANDAQVLAAAQRQRAMQRRSLDTLRIDPSAAGVGIQIPGQ